MPMFWLKACKHCGGDLREQADVTDIYVACVQCGRELTVDEERALKGVRSPAVAGTRAA